MEFVMPTNETGNTPEPLPALMSVPDAARLLGLKRASAYRYAAAGYLPTRRFGGRIYVIRAKLAEMLESDQPVTEGADAA